MGEGKRRWSRVPDYNDGIHVHLSEYHFCNPENNIPPSIGPSDSGTATEAVTDSADGQTLQDCVWHPLSLGVRYYDAGGVTQTPRTELLLESILFAILFGASTLSTWSSLAGTASSRASFLTNNY
ncbi:uncharacterized protein [Fopius arisanus]|uniref:Uncharacterized protein n=1 Tax=Fopius arisanus TaxID=64838 RepID=A0A9R1TR87_9HYME|nr:PREDICTED: uncharacterized protein LOC105273475 [Fopius arisanus]